LRATPAVKEAELLAVLRRLRDLRRWALERRMDPWAFRQALIITMEIDKEAAMLHGRRSEDLEAFDREAREGARAWIREGKK